MARKDGSGFRAGVTRENRKGAPVNLKIQKTPRAGVTLACGVLHSHRADTGAPSSTVNLLTGHHHLLGTVPALTASSQVHLLGTPASPCPEAI